MTEFFLKQELLPVTNYLPDVEMLASSRARIFMAAGERSLAKGRFYAQATRILADRLECEFVVFPGHHGSFVDRPAEFAATLRSVLDRASG